MTFWRRFPPVHASVSAAALFRAAGALTDGDGARAQAGEALQAAYADRHVLLTNSGTTALQLALNTSSRVDGAQPPCVALPAYACPDIGAAAIGAQFGIRLYDVDPHTLQPDWGSLERVLAHGVSHVVATHLYGRLVDMPTLHALATRLGVTVIEDAAQHAGGTLGGVRGGALAARSILSFGRGKGINAGGGGALLCDASVASADVPLLETTATSGFKIVLATAAADILSNPLLYWLPSSVPGLALGDTVYHAPSGAAQMSAASATFLVHALRAEPRDLAQRREVEAWYVTQLTQHAPQLLFHTLSGMQSGALRFPVRLAPEHARSLAPFGVARSYPRTLDAYPEIAGQLLGREPTPGATELARAVHTLPTHGLLRRADRARMMDALLRAAVSAR